MEIDKKIIENKIRILRESKGWTQEDLGLKIGMKQSNIVTIEKGRKFISMDKVYKILEVFNISFDYLFKDVLIFNYVQEYVSAYEYVHVYGCPRSLDKH